MIGNLKLKCVAINTDDSYELFDGRVLRDIVQHIVLVMVKHGFTSIR